MFGRCGIISEEFDKARHILGLGSNRGLLTFVEPELNSGLGVVSVVVVVAMQISGDNVFLDYYATDCAESGG